jgi:hypothetical protein
MAFRFSVVGPDRPLPIAVAFPVALMIIGLVAGWAAWVRGVTDMIDTASNRIVRRF